MTQTSTQSPTRRRRAWPAQLVCFAVAVLIGGFGQSFLIHELFDAAAAPSSSSSGNSAAIGLDLSASVELGGAVVRLSAE